MMNTRGMNERANIFKGGFRAGADTPTLKTRLSNTTIRSLRGSQFQASR